MKLKRLPEDFQVDEVADLRPSPERDHYRLYLLEKRGLDTFALLAYLAKANGIPYGQLGVAGVKDRHAVTRQYLTVPSGCEVRTLRERGFSLAPLGYVPEPLRLGDLVGNRFTITARDLSEGELGLVSRRAAGIALWGVPNYFDSQRFGSVIGGRFIAKLVAKGEWEEAVRVFLTAYLKTESGRVKSEKRRLAQEWGRLDEVRTELPLLGRVLDAYRRRRRWEDAFLAIPPNLREMYASAYQGYLWNECAKEVLRRALPRARLYPVRYRLGELLFYEGAAERDLAALPRSLATLAPDAAPAAPLEREAVEAVLRSEGVSLDELDIERQAGKGFRTRRRDLVLRPEGLALSGPEADELSAARRSRSKLTLSFTLPRGSYATVVTKGMFGR